MATPNKWTKIEIESSTGTLVDVSKFWKSTTLTRYIREPRTGILGWLARKFNIERLYYVTREIKEHTEK